MLERILTHILKIHADKRIASIRAASGDSFRTLSLWLRMYSKKNPLHIRLQQPPQLKTAPSDDKIANRKEMCESLASPFMSDFVE